MPCRCHTTYWRAAGAATARRPPRLSLAPLLAFLVAAPPCAGTASLTVAIPAGVAPDNATPAAVFCTITGGYPNNLYAIKGTFSPGVRPYFGLTWAPSRQLWASQEERWDTCQARVATDKFGNWSGHIFVRLERTAPLGYTLFRIGMVPLSPVSDPGPTVSEWYGTKALNLAVGGDGAWMEGHAYLDPACTQPAGGVIIRALNLLGGISGSYVSQYSAIPDGYPADDVGYFRFAVASGWINSVTARTRDNKAVTVYVQTQGPWIVPPGETISTDALPWGDVNGDARLNEHDVVLAMRIASGIYPGPVTYRARADVWPDPADGAVTLEDAAAIGRAVYSG